ncbi:MAG: hypothetical protein WC209_18390 [Ignavibacteriaceae bacterium]|jgi:hypothetical protein
MIIVILQILTSDTLRVASKIISSKPPDFIETNWLNIIFGIVTLIGTLIAIFSVRDSRRTKKLYQHIFKAAEQSIEKEHIEDKLSARKTELSSLTNKVLSLQQKIQKEIPIEARKAVLKDRLEESKISLKRYYDEVIQLKSKLNSLGEDSEIPDEILKSIQREIEPKYIIREKISAYQTRLSIVTTSAGISFALLPYPFDRYIGFTFFILTLPILFFLLKLSYSKYLLDKQKTNLNILIASIIVGLVIAPIFSIFTFVAFAEIKDSEARVMFLVFGLMGSTLVLFLIYFLRKFLRQKKELINRKKVSG